MNKPNRPEMAAFNLSCHTLEQFGPPGAAMQGVLLAALLAVDPAEALRNAVHRRGDILEIKGRSYNLARYRRVLLVGAGKAGTPMAQAAADLLGDRLTHGFAIVKDGYQGSQPLPKVQVVAAGHPLPDVRGLQATRHMVELLSTTQADDLVLCLISGGGSALMTLPAAGITLDDLQALTRLLLGCGASINEINALRKHLDQVKGGGLARLAAPAQMITLILSDVVGDPLDVIASGPTVPDLTTFAQAWEVLARYQILDQVPVAIRTHLQNGKDGHLQDTPKPGDPLFEHATTMIIGNNYKAAIAGLEQARRVGYQTLLLTTYLQGEARQAGRMLAAVMRQIAHSGEPIARPACLVAGGETTVTLHGDGLGGRNQECALGAVAEMAGLQNAVLITLATDGGDGPTDAAGAVVSGETLLRATAAGLKPQDYLARNDSYNFFFALGDLLRPGPTRTNVNDLAFGFLL